MLKFMTVKFKNVNTCGLFGTIKRRKCLFSKKNQVTWLWFAKTNLNKLQDFRNNEVWTDKITAVNTVYPFKHLTPQSSMVVEGW